MRQGLTEGFARDLDAEVRLAAFEWLARVVDEHGDVLLRNTLVRGFEFGGHRVPMVGPQGIFKPRFLKEVPISPHLRVDHTMTASGRMGCWKWEKTPW